MWTRSHDKVARRTRWARSAYAVPAANVWCHVAAIDLSDCCSIFLDCICTLNAACCPPRMQCAATAHLSCSIGVELARSCSQVKNYVRTRRCARADHHNCAAHVSLQALTRRQPPRQCCSGLDELSVCMHCFVSAGSGCRMCDTTPLSTVTFSYRT